MGAPTGLNKAAAPSVGLNPADRRETPHTPELSLDPNSGEHGGEGHH